MTTTLLRRIRDRADVLHADDIIDPGHPLTQEYLSGHPLANQAHHPATITSIIPDFHPGITRIVVTYLCPGDTTVRSACYHFPSNRIIPVLRPEYTS